MTEKIQKKKIVNFYIDGFNFYYGIKEMTKIKTDWRKFYWIDIVKLFEQFLLEGEEIGTVHYFTARPKNQGKMARQNMLLNCNKAINGDKLKIHYGKYQDKPIICRASCKQTFMHWEEKQTDVSLAIKMIEECHNSICQKIVLVSGDSDFLPPLNLIKNFYKQLELTILFPPCKHTTSMANLGFPIVNMHDHKPKWNKSLLENEVVVKGIKYRKPTEWF